MASARCRLGFSLLAGFGATTLRPGATTTFQVRLNATAAGSYSGRISFTNDDLSGADGAETIHDLRPHGHGGGKTQKLVHRLKEA